MKRHVNRRANGNPVAGVCRMRSKGTDLLQLADLFLGAVVYEHKAQHGLVRYKPKLHLLHYLKQQAGIATFVGGHRDETFNVAEYSP